MTHSHSHPLLPACPYCGSRDKVVRMAVSLTPFERPQRDDFEQAHFFCQSCSHDFIPDVQNEDGGIVDAPHQRVR